MSGSTYKHVCARGVSKYATIGAHDYCHIDALVSITVFEVFVVPSPLYLLSLLNAMRTVKR